MKGHTLLFTKLHSEVEPVQNSLFHRGCLPNFLTDKTPTGFFVFPEHFQIRNARLDARQDGSGRARAVQSRAPDAVRSRTRRDLALAPVDVAIVHGQVEAVGDVPLHDLHVLAVQADRHDVVQFAVAPVEHVGRYVQRQAVRQLAVRAVEDNATLRTVQPRAFNARIPKKGRENNRFHTKQSAQ